MIRVFTMAVLALLAKAAHQGPDHLTTAPPPAGPEAPIASPDRGSSPGDWVDRTLQLGSRTAPPAAEDCTAIVDTVANRMVLFGGKGDDDRDLNEVWTLDLDKFAWAKVETPGPAPPGSEDHVAVFDPVGYRMIVHGGENGLTTNKTWALDLKSLRWRDLTDSTAPGREDHTAIYDSRGRRMVIFGGRDNTGTIDYVNEWNLPALDLDPRSRTFEKWIELKCGDVHAPGRSDHTAIYDPVKNRMVIFGGWDKQKHEYMDDTWAYYFANSPDSAGTWKKIRTKESHPPARRHVVGVYDDRRNWFIVCGGYGDQGFLNDVWAFDLTRDLWINITPGPQPRLDHQAVFDPRRGQMLLYGGDAHWARKLHDVWELDVHPGVSADSLR